MSFLTINGYDVSIAKDACNVDDVEVGERGRAYDGTARSTVRAFKREWKCTTTPNTASDADMLRGLLRGQAERWDWDSSDAYGSKGSLFPVAPGSYATGGKWNTGGKYVNFSLGSVSSTGFASTAGFLSFWQLRQDGSGVWDHWLVAAGGALYKNGASFSTSTYGVDYACMAWTSGGFWCVGAPVYAANGGAVVTRANTTAYATGTAATATASGTPYLFIASVGGTSAGSPPVFTATYGATTVDGAVTWKNVGPMAASVDELSGSSVIAPSATLVSAFAANQVGAYPKLLLSGDIVSNASVTVLAQVHSEHHLQYSDATGTWQAGARTLEFTLQEV